MEDNKVKVRIYGQEYTISGERDEETIVRIADYVDDKMREISRFFSSNIPGSLAVLASINIADELFGAREETARLKEENARIKEQIAKVKEETRRLEKEIAKNLIAASSYPLSEIAKITGLEEYELKNLSS